MLELHVDDTGGEVAEDMLTELAFYVPPGNEDFPAQGEEVPPAKVGPGRVGWGWGARGGVCVSVWWGGWHGVMVVRLFQSQCKPLPMPGVRAT